jgi:hypothetical protein
MQSRSIILATPVNLCSHEHINIRYGPILTLTSANLPKKVIFFRRVYTDFLCIQTDKGIDSDVSPSIRCTTPDDDIVKCSEPAIEGGTTCTCPFLTGVKTIGKNTQMKSPQRSVTDLRALRKPLRTRRLESRWDPTQRSYFHRTLRKFLFLNDKRMSSYKTPGGTC